MSRTSVPILTPLGLRLLSLSSAAPCPLAGYVTVLDRRGLPSLSEDGLGASLRALTGWGLLRRSQEGYSLTRAGEWLLDRHWSGTGGTA